MFSLEFYAKVEILAKAADNYKPKSNLQKKFSSLNGKIFLTAHHIAPTN